MDITWGVLRQRALRSGLALLLSALLGPTVDDLIDLFDRASELEDDTEETQQHLDEIDATLAQQRAELAERTERLEEAEAELAAVEHQLTMVEQELALAEDRYAEARLAHLEAVARLGDTETELAENERAFEEQVVAAYSLGVVQEMAVVQAALREETIGAVLHSWQQLSSAGVNQSVHVAELTALRDEQRVAEALAEQAKHHRDEQRAAAQRARDSVAELRDEQQQLRDEVAAHRDEQQELVSVIETDRDAQQELLEEVRAELADVRERTDHTIRQIGISSDGIVCPVPGAQFVNDWHYPRSGGRRHEGNDLFADVGTPILSTADGTVRSRNDVDRWSPGSQAGLGGRTVAIVTEPGTWWYFAHLDEIADDVRPGARVQAGQKIGTVGKTGNARHTPPHLHIGYYRGGAAHNPYPLIAPACR